MSRSTGERRARNLRGRLLTGLLALFAVAAALSPSPAAGQAAAGASAPILGSQQVRYSLARLQEGWLQWTTALYGNDAERAREVVDGLVETVRRLGMREVPDLAAGALVQAVEAARRGEPEQAALALEAAERLAPGRPEISFAAAEVARLSGDWPGMILAEAKGYARLPATVLERRLALFDLALWALASALLAAALFVVLAMVVHGPALVEDLGRWIGGKAVRLPGPLVAVLAVLTLGLPLALPAGILWLLLFWSFLLWGYLAGSGRAVLAFGWIATLAAPVLVEAIDQRVAVALSPPVRAMESVARGSLYGGLFADLGALPAALPEEPAVDHFLADLHLRLGQWDEARRLYARVLDAEPENVPALVNLGAYYFDREDFGNAVHYFRQAATAPEGGRSERAAAYYDLSHAYADSNLFDEQREAFSEARRIDPGLVNQWRRRPEARKIVTVEGGVARHQELESILRRRRQAPGTTSPGLSLLRRALPALLVLFLAAAAIVAHAVVGPRPRPPETAADTVPRGAAARLGRRWLLPLAPGFTAMRSGHAGRAFATLLLVSASALVLLVGIEGLGYRLPWRHDPVGAVVPAAAALCLVGFVLVQLARAFRAGPVIASEKGGA